MIEGFRHLGLLAIILLSLGLAYIVIAWPLSRHNTFSQHIAKSRISIVYYIVLFAIVLPLLALFFLWWFSPSLKLSLYFNVCIMAALVAQFVCTLIPETGSWRSTVHRLFAAISALLLIPALGLVLVSREITSLDQLLVFIGLGAMVVCVFLVARGKGWPRNFLLIQCAYFAAFFLPIIVISYF